MRQRTVEKEEKEIKSVTRFMDWAKGISRLWGGAKILYRGHSSSKWEVSSSLARRLGGGGKKIEENHELWERTQIILRMAEELGYYEKEKGQKHDSLSLLAHLQHFDAATCLIDFTRSPLIALWFACQPHVREDSGRVIALNTSLPKYSRVSADDRDSIMKEWKDRIYKSYPEDKSSLQIWRPEQENNRIIAQQSEFVLGAVTIEPDAACVIPGNQKQKILSDLERIGLTEESLFPDPDGFAHINRHDKPFLYMDDAWYYEKGLECDGKGEYGRALVLFSMAKRKLEESKEAKILLKGGFITVKDALEQVDRYIKSTKNKMAQERLGDADGQN